MVFLEVVDQMFVIQTLLCMVGSVLVQFPAMFFFLDLLQLYLLQSLTWLRYILADQYVWQEVYLLLNHNH